MRPNITQVLIMRAGKVCRGYLDSKANRVLAVVPGPDDKPVAWDPVSKLDARMQRVLNEIEQLRRGLDAVDNPSTK